MAVPAMFFQEDMGETPMLRFGIPTERTWAKSGNAALSS
jgi:hypothetical protein